MHVQFSIHARCATRSERLHAMACISLSLSLTLSLSAGQLHQTLRSSSLWPRLRSFTRTFPFWRRRSQCMSIHRPSVLKIFQSKCDRTRLEANYAEWSSDLKTAASRRRTQTRIGGSWIMGSLDGRETRGRRDADLPSSRSSTWVVTERAPRSTTWKLSAIRR